MYTMYIYINIRNIKKFLCINYKYINYVAIREYRGGG